MATAHGAHAHDDHHDDHHTPTGWRRYVYSTNHKDIGTMYLVFAIIAALIGATFSVVMRLELLHTGVQYFNAADGTPNGHLWNTVVQATGAWLLQLVFCTAAAYALSKLRPAFGKVILGGILATLMVPAQALVVPKYLTVADLPVLHTSLLNSPLGIWLPAVANAFNLYLLKRFFDQIPRDVLEAAEIDGAGKLRTLWSIVLPMSRPVLGVVSIFALVAVWQDFLWPLMVFSDTGKQPISVALVQLSQNIQLTVLIAAMVIASIPMVALFLLFQRHIIAGISAGSTKG